jgi:vitamin B12 transporter
MRKIFTVAAFIYCSHVHAQQDSSSNLDQVVITATKFPVKQSNTGKVVTIVTKEQLEHSSGKDLAQVLNEQTGILVSGSNSNPGKDKSVFLRGASSNYTLFLLDGIPLNDPTGIGGTFDIRLIPLEQIERIEIVKGSQSTLYGSNAIAGVINIITRKPENDQLSGNGLVSYGSFNTFKGNASLSKKGKILEYNLNYQYLSSDGISEAKDTTGNAHFDKDGFIRQSFQANVGINISDHVKVSPYFRYSQFSGGYDMDAFTDGPEQFNATMANAGLISRIKYASGELNILYGYDHIQSNYSGSVYSGKFHHAEAYINQNFSDAINFLAGVSYQAFQLPKPDTVNTLISPYASIVLHYAGLHVEVGGRYNKHNRYGDNLTYSFNPSYLINDRIKLFVDLSSGFRVPSIGELFGPFGPNPNLKPENSYTQEGGIQVWVLNKKLSFIASYFNRDIKNIITYDYPQGYVNRDQQQDHGIETEINYSPDAKWKLRASYTFIDGQITQKQSLKDTTFYNLIRRPKNTVDLFASLQLISNLLVSTSIQYFGKRIDNYYNPANFYAVEIKTLDAYTLWNLHAEFSLPNHELTLFADAKNLLNNTNYYEVYGFNVQGLNITAGVKFKL